MELPEFSGWIRWEDDKEFPGDGGFYIGGNDTGKVDFVMAPRPEQIRGWTPTRESQQCPCSVCLALLWVSKKSRKIMATGVPLICIDCARRKSKSVN